MRLNAAHGRLMLGAACAGGEAGLRRRPGPDLAPGRRSASRGGAPQRAAGAAVGSGASLRPPPWGAGGSAPAVLWGGPAACQAPPPSQVGGPGAPGSGGKRRGRPVLPAAPAGRWSRSLRPGIWEQPSSWAGAAGRAGTLPQPAGAPGCPGPHAAATSGLPAGGESRRAQLRAASPARVLALEVRGGRRWDAGWRLRGRARRGESGLMGAGQPRARGASRQS